MSLQWRRTMYGISFYLYLILSKTWKGIELSIDCTATPFILKATWGTWICIVSHLAQPDARFQPLSAQALCCQTLMVSLFIKRNIFSNVTKILNYPDSLPAASYFLITSLGCLCEFSVNTDVPVIGLILTRNGVCYLIISLHHY